MSATAAIQNWHNRKRDDDHCRFLAPTATGGCVDAVLSTWATGDAQIGVNASLILDRFPRWSHIDHSKIEKGKEQEQGQAVHLAAVVTASATAWKPAHYAEILQHLEGGVQFTRLTAQSRIALHLSRAGGLENANCCLHPVHGFAYLPGSGLKGLAHAYACHLFHQYETCKSWRDGQREDFIREVEAIFGWAPNRERTGKAFDWSPRSGRGSAGSAGCQPAHTADAGKPPALPEAQRGLVVFHDAFGESAAGLPPELEIDVCTPHYGPYYHGEAPPGDWHSPVPVTFLTIAAGMRFRFRVGKADEHRCREELLAAAKRLLLGGLHWLGAGAKTAAGYGWFEDEWDLDDQRRQQREEEQVRQRAEAVRAQETQAQAAAAQRIEVDKQVELAAKAAKIADVLKGLDPAKRALWQPKEKGSRTGYRLILSDSGEIQKEAGWEFGKQHRPNATDADQLFFADINQDPTVPKRLLNPIRC